jgi:hypothetical protein
MRERTLVSIPRQVRGGVTEARACETGRMVVIVRIAGKAHNNFGRILVAAFREEMRVFPGSRAVNLLDTLSHNSIKGVAICHTTKAPRTVV